MGPGPLLGSDPVAGAELAGAELLPGAVVAGGEPELLLPQAAKVKTAAASSAAGSADSLVECRLCISRVCRRNRLLPIDAGDPSSGVSLAYFAWDRPRLPKGYSRPQVPLVPGAVRPARGG